jgi:hypothetical protein
VLVGRRTITLVDVIGGQRRDAQTSTWLPLFPGTAGGGDEDEGQGQAFEVVVPPNVPELGLFSVDVGLGELWKVQCPAGCGGGSIIKVNLPVNKLVGTVFLNVCYTTSQEYKLKVKIKFSSLCLPLPLVPLFTLYSMLDTLYMLYSVLNYTLYSVLCTLYSLFSTLNFQILNKTQTLNTAGSRQEACRGLPIHTLNPKH